MKVKRDFKGVWIPKEIYLMSELNWTQKILLVEIHSLDNGEGCYATNQYFADFLGVSAWTISTSISKLEELRLVMTRTINNNGQAQRRIYTLLKNLKGYWNNPNTPLEKPKEGYVENPKHNNTKNNTKNNTPSKTQQEKIKLFEEFWIKYDKKVGKKQCQSKFLRLKMSDIESIMSSVEPYVESTPDVKYRKHPITWLNQEAWNDVVIKEDEKRSKATPLIIETNKGKILL
jgi:hypothetical protein